MVLITVSFESFFQDPLNFGISRILWHFWGLDILAAIVVRHSIPNVTKPNVLKLKFGLPKNRVYIQVDMSIIKESRIQLHFIGLIGWKDCIIAFHFISWESPHKNSYCTTWLKSGKFSTLHLCMAIFGVLPLVYFLKLKNSVFEIL